MLNISHWSKDKVGLRDQIWGKLFKPDRTVMSELAIYSIGQLVGILCYITFKVLTAK